MPMDNVWAAFGQRKMTKLIPIALGVMAVAATAFLVFLYYRKKKEESEAPSPGPSMASVAAQVKSAASTLPASLPSGKELKEKLSQSLSSAKGLESKLPPLPDVKELESKLPSLPDVKELESKLPSLNGLEPSKPSAPTKSSVAVKDESKTAQLDSSKSSAIAEEPPNTTTQGSPKSPIKEPSKSSPSQDKPQTSSAKDVLLQDPSEKYNLKLVDKKILSHDTRRFRFALPSEAQILGLPVGQHVYLSANVDGKTVIRPYTPVSSNDEKGHMDLVVKIYFKNVNPDFPNGGKFSQHLESLKINDGVDVRGPTGSLLYRGNGQFDVQVNKKKPPTEYRTKRVGMIAGGTGITPMFQLLQHALQCPKDDTTFSLVYANRLLEDILLRDELEDMAKKNPNRFKLWYTLTKPPQEGWKYNTGRINSEMVVSHLPKPSDDVIILLCGPDAMVNSTCLPILKTLGYKNHFVY